MELPYTTYLGCIKFVYIGLETTSPYDRGAMEQCAKHIDYSDLQYA